jgi:hypothetical protein
MKKVIRRQKKDGLNLLDVTPPVAASVQQLPLTVVHASNSSSNELL